MNASMPPVEQLVEDLVRVWRREAALASELLPMRAEVRRLARLADVVRLLDESLLADIHAAAARVQPHRAGDGSSGHVEDLVAQLLEAITREARLADEVARHRRCLQELERRAAARAGGRR